jgi:acyl-CoA synthetase (AMP-forming)/AMP-acid ligase II
VTGPSPSDPRLTFARFLADTASQHRDRVAVVSDAGAVTYGELEARVRAVARALIGAGVVKGARVAVWMENGPDWITATYAAASLGAVVVPVNTFASPAERDHILRHSDASVLLMQPALGKHRFLDDLLRDHAELASGHPGRPRSSRGASCSRKRTTCRTRCSTPYPRRWSPPTTR